MLVPSLSPGTYSTTLTAQPLALQQPWVLWLQCTHGLVSVRSSLSLGRVPQSTLDTSRSIGPQTIQSGVAISRQLSSLYVGSRRREEYTPRGGPGTARGQAEPLRCTFILVGRPLLWNYLTFSMATACCNHTSAPVPEVWGARTQEPSLWACHTEHSLP